MKNSVRNLVLGVALTLASVAAEARQLLELDMRNLRSGVIDIKRELQYSNRYLDLRDAEILAVKVDGTSGRRQAAQVELIIDGRSEDQRVLGRNEFDPRFRELDRYNGVLLINRGADLGNGRGGGGRGRDHVDIDDGRGGGRGGGGGGGGVVIGDPYGREQEWLLASDRNARLTRVIVLIEDRRGGGVPGRPDRPHQPGRGRLVDLGELKIDKVVGEVATINARVQCATGVILTARGAEVQIDRVRVSTPRNRGVELYELTGSLRNGQQAYADLGRRCMNIDQIVISAVSPMVLGPSGKLRVQIEVQ